MIKKNLSNDQERRPSEKQIDSLVRKQKHKTIV